jgi:hypothetical protein
VDYQANHFTIVINTQRSMLEDIAEVAAVVSAATIQHAVLHAQSCWNYKCTHESCALIKSAASHAAYCGLLEAECPVSCSMAW